MAGQWLRPPEHLRGHTGSMQSILFNMLSERTLHVPIARQNQCMVRSSQVLTPRLHLTWLNTRALFWQRNKPLPKTCTNYSCSQGPYKHQAPLSSSCVSFSFNNKILKRKLVFWVRRLYTSEQFDRKIIILVIPWDLLSCTSQTDSNGITGQGAKGALLLNQHDKISTEWRKCWQKSPTFPWIFIQTNEYITLVTPSTKSQSLKVGPILPNTKLIKEQCIFSELLAHPTACLWGLNSLVEQYIITWHSCIGSYHFHHVLELMMGRIQN